MFIKKNKSFGKNLFLSLHFPFVKIIRRNRQGFTVIGVLVASAIGVIVVTGVSQLFINMASQLRQVENKAKHTFFNEFVGSQLRTGCENTLQAHSTHIFGGAGTDKQMSFTQIRNANNRIVADLTSEKDRLESEYGITGDSYFQLKCVGWDHDSNPSTPMDNDCDCSSQTLPCGRIWSLSLISQSKTNDVLVYKRSFSFELDINYTAAPPNPLTCNVTAISGVSTPISSGDCILIDKSADIALVGCGTTTDITDKTTTAYGFNAGFGGSTGSWNTFVGYQAGEKTTGTQNTFLGYQTGYGQTTATGGYNTFVGFQAGFSNESGGENTFLGSNAGHDNTTGTDNTFIGFQAGQKNISGTGSTFIGYQVGQENTAGNNTFIGFQAGQKNTSGTGSTFIGYQAGQENTAGNNTFIGFQAGQKNTSGDKNTFVGYLSGAKSGTTSYDNTFLGYQAGTATTFGARNTFIGSNAGQKHTSGHNNTFIGHNAGNSNTTQTQNTFIGMDSGKNSTGNYNTFVGYYAGYNNTGNANVFFGERAGQNNTSGADNTFLGLGAGAENTTGSGNIFIGRDAARTTSYKTVSNRFIVGNNSNKDWVVGNIGTYDVEVNGEKICLENGTNCPTIASGGTPSHSHTLSSRTVKKNIKPFKSFKKALKDLLKTPLFTYEYKKDHPEKSRMGIISEELPEHLQIKDKGKPSQPDWPSIYGSFWAGIKALHEMIEELKQELLFEIIERGKAFSQKLEKLVKDFNQLKTEFSNIKKELATSKKTLEQNNKSLSAENKKLSKEIVNIKSKWNQTRTELKDTKANFARELSQFKTELSAVKAENKKLSKEMADTKAKWDEVNKELSKSKK